MNPNMMGMMPQAMPDIPSVQTLWKDEKNKYRHWVILFAISLIVLFSLITAAAVYGGVDFAHIKKFLINKWSEAKESGDLAKNDYSNLVSGVDKSITMKYIIFPAVQSGLIGVSIILFLTSIFTVYKDKNFARLSGFPTIIVGLGAFLSLYQLISIAWNKDALDFQLSSQLFLFIVNFIFIGAYFAGSMQISKIRRLFMVSERMALFKQSPQYQAMQQQMQAMQNGQVPPQQNNNINNPYGPAMATQSTSASPTQTQVEQPEKVNAIQLSEEEQELYKMKINELKEVAKKLSISGYETMKKEELISNILRVTKNDK